MDIADYVKFLDHEGRLTARAAEEAGTGAEVPTCPGWRVRDLLEHLGTAHRWAARFVAEGLTSYHSDDGPPDLDGAELLTWFRDGHRALVDTLTGASPDVECWHFLPAPSPLAFWARRQAHETAVHRVDAELALGGALSEITPAFAADGVDELLAGFHARTRSKVRSPEPLVWRVRATDMDGAVWTVRLSPEPPVTVRDGADAGVGKGAGDVADDVDCELSGKAAEVYLSLWNRLPFPEVIGDRSVTDLWRRTSAVTWR